MKNALRILAGCLLLQAVPFCAFSLRATETSDRVALFPKFASGQSFAYEIGYSAETNTITESTVAAPMAPAGGKTEVHLLLRAEVEGLGVDAGVPFARIGTYLADPDSFAGAGGRSSSASSRNDWRPSKMVEFTLYRNGQVSDLAGFDALTPDEQKAWREWLARFGAEGALPEKGLKAGDKWRTEEPITNALLTGLSWDKESQYVDDEACGAGAGMSQSDSSSAVSALETCAVILTTATLRQKNPQKDATPEDYKLHDLRTAGIANGKNEVITYISRTTGLVVRATENDHQSMTVTVAKSDGSSRVHYNIDAQSHAQVLLLSSTAIGGN